MICFHVSDSMTDAQQHYLVQHIEEEDDDVRMKADDILDTEMECNTSVLNKVKKTMPYTKMLQPKNNGSTGNNDRHTSQTMMREPGRKSIAASRTHFAGSSDSNSAEDTPIDMSPNSDSYEPYGSIGQLNDDHMQFDVTSNASKSGYVNCAVCNVTRFYSCVQRRYGQFTCVTCYRYFRSFMLQPKRYSCPRLGECLLNVRTRCRACWIKACIDLFTVDAVRKQIIEANRPLRRECSPAEEDEQMLDTLDDGFANDIDDDEKLDTSDDNNNSLSEKAFNNLIVDLPSLLSKAGGNGFGLLNYPSQLLGFGQLNADTNNNNPSLMNGSTSIASTNGSLAASTTTTTQIHNGSNNGSSNSAHGLLLAAATKHGLSNGTSNGGSNASSPLPTHNSGASNTTSTGHNLAKAAAAVAAAAASLKQPKVSNSKKIWSCGKCATCVAEDCGKCIYCLDRPKFGGPFIKKQRCIKRRCLMKVKNKGNGPNDSVVNGTNTEFSLHNYTH